MPQNGWPLVSADFWRQLLAPPAAAMLGGSRVVISGVISPLFWAIIMVTLLITPLITTHEPLRGVLGSIGLGVGLRDLWLICGFLYKALGVLSQRLHVPL